MKDNDYENLTRPVSAFITFEEEDGYIKALEYEAKDFLGKGGKIDPVTGYKKDPL